MERLLKGKERRNSLVILAILGLLVAGILLLPASEETLREGDFTADISRDEVVPQEQVLLFTGDIMLSRAVGDVMEKTNDWKYPFLYTAEFLKSADVTFGNLEGPISSGGERVGSIYSFRADPKAIEGLVYAGFDVLSLANNHMWDYGPYALEDTVKILESAGIDSVGAGLDYERAYEPVIKKVGDAKIAYLAYTSLIPAALGSKEAAPAIALLNLETAVAHVKAAKTSSDIIIVSLHWGEEYKVAPDEYQEKVARDLIDAGASLIIGHHPHVVQKIEKYESGWVAYSLGNFVFDQTFSAETMSGMVLKVIIKDKKIESVEPIEIKINNSFQPFLADLE